MRTRRTVTLAPLVAIALVITGCGGDDSDEARANDPSNPDHYPDCADVFAHGRSTADVVTQANAEPGMCADGDTLHVTTLVSFPCTAGDGTVHYTSSGYAWSSWGIDGAQWQPMPPGQDAPDVDVC